MICKVFRVDIILSTNDVDDCTWAPSLDATLDLRGSMQAICL